MSTSEIVYVALKSDFFAPKWAQELRLFAGFICDVGRFRIRLRLRVWVLLILIT